VGNDGVVAPRHAVRWGMEHSAATDVAWLDARWGVDVRRLRWADGALSRDELCIYVGCCSVDGVDRGQSIDCPVGPVAVLERARSRAFDFFKILDECSVALTFGPGVLILLLLSFQFSSDHQI